MANGLNVCFGLLQSWCTTLPIDLGHKGLQLKLEPHESSSNAMSSREGQYSTHRSNGVSKGNQRVCYNRLRANCNVQVVRGCSVWSGGSQRQQVGYFIPKHNQPGHSLTSALLAASCSCYIGITASCYVGITSSCLLLASPPSVSLYIASVPRLGISNYLRFAILVLVKSIGAVSDILSHKYAPSSGATPRC